MEKIEQKGKTEFSSFLGNKSSKIRLGRINKIIGVMAGKGGVGKSTIAALLAMNLAERGGHIALVDADVYGPSVPTLLGARELPEVQDNKIEPLSWNVGRGQLYAMSLGYLIDAQSAAIWRGPMLVKTLAQMLTGTNWPELDCMIIDLPPGTGDLHLTLMQRYHVDGMLLVTTPSELSYADCARATAMALRMDVPVLGVVENMSYRNTWWGMGKSRDFGKSKVEEFAAEHNISNYIQLPMDKGLNKGKNLLGNFSTSKTSYGLGNVIDWLNE